MKFNMILSDFRHLPYLANGPVFLSSTTALPSSRLSIIGSVASPRRLILWVKRKSIIMQTSFITDLERRAKCRCGKVSFDKRGAQGKRNQLMKLGKVKKLRIYQCPLLDTWHLTSNV